MSTPVDADPAASPVGGAPESELATAVADAAASRADAEVAAALFGALFEASPDGLLLIDADGIVRAANQSLAAMFGIAPHGMIGVDVASLLPEVAAAVFRLERGLSARDPDASATSLAYDADGEAFPVDLELTSVDAVGERFTLACVRDLSARQAAALTLAHAAADLQAAREVHDSAIQQVFAAGMMLRAAMSTADPDGVRDRISTATEGLDATIDQLRTAIERLGGLDGLIDVSRHSTN